jgi:hypothetical protein
VDGGHGSTHQNKAATQYQLNVMEVQEVVSSERGYPHLLITANQKYGELEGPVRNLVDGRCD